MNLILPIYRWANRGWWRTILFILVMSTIMTAASGIENGMMVVPVALNLNCLCCYLHDRRQARLKAIRLLLALRDTG